MNEPLFVFHGIQKTFAKVEILRKVDLSLYPEKCTLITGKNGSGKTTLLKIIAGLEKPEKAEIEFSGKSHSWEKIMPDICKEIIYLHQQAFLFSSTVESNIAYGLRFKNMTREQRRKSVKMELELSGLTEFAKKQANTLSGGVQQRVAFARACILKPKVLLLDEPVSNMDRQSREHACHSMQLLKSTGTSIVITSHVPQYFDGLADMHFELVNGKLIET